MTNGAKHWDTAYERKAIALLTLGFGLVGLDRWIIAPLAPAMLADLRLTPADINNLVAALGIAWGLAALFMGGLSDRLGRKKVLIPALVIFSLLSGFSGAAASMTMLLLARSCMGISEVAFCPTSFAATAEASKPSRRGLNLGLQQSAFPLLGLGLGPILATQLLQFMSWRYVFAIVAIPGLVLALLLAMVIREPVTIDAPGAAKAPRAPLSEIFRHRNVPLGMIGLLCAMCGIFVLSANTPIYLTQFLGLGMTQMGFVTSAIGLGGFVGQWSLSGLSDLLGRRVIAIASFALGALCLWLFIQAGPGNLPLLFALLFMAAAFSFGLLGLITGPIAAEAAPIGLISTVAGIIIGTGEIFGGGVAPFIAGGIAGRYGIQYTLYMALGGLLLGVIVSLFYRETAPGKATAVSDLDRLEKDLGGGGAG